MESTRTLAGSEGGEVQTDLLSAIVESSDAAIIGKSLEGVILSWNPAAERIFGYTASEAIGKSISLIIPDDHLDEMCDILAAIQRGERVDHLETDRVRKDGTIIKVSLTVSPIRDAQGNVVGASKVSRDVTKARREGDALQKSQEKLRLLNAELERRVDERTAELRAANQEMEGFTQSVSHDLRAPLRAIMASSMILIEDFGDKLPDDAKDHLHRQANAAKKLSSLIDDLLQYSRLGRKLIDPQPVSMSGLAQDVVDDITKRHPEEKVLWHIRPGLKARGDPNLIAMLLQNLLENAHKFTAHCDAAVIEFDKDEQGFFVRDNGIGFEMKYVDKLFRPFERLHHEAAYAGTGIGLANVKRIIERHGGQIWAEGSPNKGATFHFTLGK